MRISDWSSDVCSSDLVFGNRDLELCIDVVRACRADVTGEATLQQHATRAHADRHHHAGRKLVAGPLAGHAHRQRELEEVRMQRSEEHTSELQSLMRISYAVFCLKKKKRNKT